MQAPQRQLVSINAYLIQYINIFNIIQEPRYIRHALHIKFYKNNIIFLITASSGRTAATISRTTSGTATTSTVAIAIAVFATATAVAAKGATVAIFATAAAAAAGTRGLERKKSGRKRESKR